MNSNKATHQVVVSVSNHMTKHTKVIDVVVVGNNIFKAYDMSPTLWTVDADGINLRYGGNQSNSGLIRIG